MQPSLPGLYSQDLYRLVCSLQLALLVSNCTFYLMFQPLLLSIFYLITNGEYVFLVVCGTLHVTMYEWINRMIWRKSMVWTKIHREWERTNYTGIKPQDRYVKGTKEDIHKNPNEQKWWRNKKTTYSDHIRKRLAKERRVKKIAWKGVMEIRNTDNVMNCCHDRL